jgi:hypothetical protein
VNAIGIVPAAGVGKRWGYYPKFLLPCGEREWLLDRTIRAMPCENVIVIVCKETASSVSEHIRGCELSQNVIFLERKDDWSLLRSVRAAMRVDADFYYFAMPDTYWPSLIFETMGKSGITLGVHYTEMPERFGMLRGDRVVDKKHGSPGHAWGVLGWDRGVRDLWLHARIETHTQAINLAIQECGLRTVTMDYYYDMASWKDYVAFVEKVK